MGIKLLWTGLTLIFAFELLKVDQPWQLAGVIVMIIGAVLMWLDK